SSQNQARNIDSAADAATTTSTTTQTTTTITGPTPSSSDAPSSSSSSNPLSTSASNPSTTSTSTAEAAATSSTSAPSSSSHPPSSAPQQEEKIATTTTTATSTTTAAQALSWWEYMGWTSSSSGASAAPSGNGNGATSAGGTGVGDPEAGVQATADASQPQDRKDGSAAEAATVPQASAEQLVAGQDAGADGDAQPSASSQDSCGQKDAEGSQFAGESGAGVDAGTSTNTTTTTTTTVTATTTATETTNGNASTTSTSPITNTTSGGGWLASWWFTSSTTTSDAHRDQEDKPKVDVAAEHVEQVAVKVEPSPIVGSQNGSATHDQQQPPPNEATLEAAAPEADDTSKAEQNSSQPSSPSPSKSKDAETSHPNPILATLTTNRAGWASFFSSSSRGLIVKSLGYGSEEGHGQRSAIEGAPKNQDEGEVKRDENGMEVMEIDLDEDGEVEVELRKELGLGGAAAAVSSVVDGKGTEGTAQPPLSPQNVEAAAEGEENRGRDEEKKDVGSRTGTQRASKPATGSLADASTISKVLAAVMPASKPLITSSSSKRSAPTSPKQVAFPESQGGPSSRPGSIKGSSSNESTKSSSASTSGKAVKHKTSLVKQAPPLMISEEVRRSASPASSAPQNINGAKGSGSSIKGSSRVGTPLPGETAFSPGSSVGSAVGGGATTSTTTTTTASKTIATSSKITSTTSTTTINTKSRTSSPAPSISSSKSKKPPAAPSQPNWVLPTWEHIFHGPPRSVIPPSLVTEVERAFKGKSGKGAAGIAGTTGKGEGSGLLGKTMRFVSGVLLGGGSGPAAGTSVGANTAPGSGAHPSNSGSGLSLLGSAGKGKQKARSGSLSFSSGLGQPHVPADAADGERLSILEKERLERFQEFGRELPKAWKVLEDTFGAGVVERMMGLPASSPGPEHGHGVTGESAVKDVLRGCRRVVVIGVHGWFPGTMIRTLAGEPTGTSTKFANMTEQALWAFEEEYGVKLEKITKIPLEGEGTIEKRVERLYSNLKANEEWMSDLHEADVIFVSTHSQGSVVSTHLLDRLITDGHIITSKNEHLQYTSSVPTGSETEGVKQSQSPLGMGAEVFPSAIGLGSQGDVAEGDNANGHGKRRKVQRVCCLALCGIHLGPLRYLGSSTLVGPYIQYFENTAARELFEFQNTESPVSKAYVKALENVLDHGTKVVYIASLNDQVVPLYSGLFAAVSHPLILRALYIDGDAYHSSDFLSNLLVLLLRIVNSGMSDSGLITHLSEATAGSLTGIGHSTAYEELATYSLAVKYLFLTNDGQTEHSKMTIEPFNATSELNDYEIPWSLRDIIADERVTHFFGSEIAELRDAFKEWHPKTSILRDLKKKLQPITKLQPLGGSMGAYSSLGNVRTSKL
ncbi:hypothetical protein CVT26_012498, partial [Gymnopilus dilepis]